MHAAQQGLDGVNLGGELVVVKLLCRKQAIGPVVVGSSWPRRKTRDEVPAVAVPDLERVGSLLASDSVMARWGQA